jgi:antitoxin VapB
MAIFSGYRATSSLLLKTIHTSLVNASFQGLVGQSRVEEIQRVPERNVFEMQEVFMRKVGKDVVLSPRPLDWSSYLAEAPVASADFMEGIEDLPAQEREA